MNKETQRKINEALQQVRISNRSGLHDNCIRLNPNKKHHQHNIEIIKRCLEYLYNGTPFLTEAIFNNGQRADILLPSIPLIEEVMITETDKYFETKNYPFPIKQIKIKPIQKGTGTLNIPAMGIIEQESEIYFKRWDKKYGNNIDLHIKRSNTSVSIPITQLEFENLKEKINKFEV